MEHKPDNEKDIILKKNIIKKLKKEIREEENIDTEKNIFEKIKKNYIANYYHKFLSQKNHHLIIPIAGFFDTIFMVIPMDVITIAYLLKHQKTKILPFSFIGSLSTTLGALVVFSLGYFFSEQISYFFLNLLDFLNLDWLISNSYNSTMDTISKNQSILTFIASLTSTVPFAVLSFTAGGLKFNVFYFLSSIFIGRFLKFLIVSYITKYYGPAVLKKISKNFTLFLIFISIIFFIKILFF